MGLKELHHREAGEGLFPKNRLHLLVRADLGRHANRGGRQGARGGGGVMREQRQRGMGRREGRWGEGEGGRDVGGRGKEKMNG
jgi:hypothetical protein